MPPEQAGALTCLQFDSTGELLVAGSEEGLLTVHSGPMLTAERASGGGCDQHPPASQQQPAPAQPLLALDCGLPKLQSVRWNSVNENVVGAVSSASRQLPLYDLQHTQGRPMQVCRAPLPSRAAPRVASVYWPREAAPCSSNAPAAAWPALTRVRRPALQVLSAPPATSASALGGATAVGMSDVAFFRSSQYLVAAGGQGGQVFLWDGRAKASPAAVLASQSGGAVYALQLVPGEQVLWRQRAGRAAAAA